MNIINLSVPAGVASPVADCGPVMIGYVGEHGVTQVMLDFSAWAEAYGEGIVTLGVQRSGDPTWYPVALETDGSSAVWTVSDVDTQVTGMGKARFAYTVAGAEKRSAVWAFYVAEGLVSPEGDVPDPYKSWVERMEQVGAETLQNAQDAQEAATEAEEDKKDAETAAEGASASKKDAEAWAVGERDGVPVPETDPTYQNNAKYWAEQAQTDSPVTSVNGKKGDVTLDAEDVGALPDDTTLDDVPDGTTYKRPTVAQVQQIGTNAADIQTQGGEIEQLQADVNTIEGKIPNQASPQNQLADKEFVNSSINSAAAYFRGAFATRAALFAVPWQTVDPEAANYVSNNDYAYVADDETHDDEAWRYIYVLQPGGPGNGWQPQFKINESPLTAAQLAALNSGATASLIDQIRRNQAAILTKQARINAAGILKGAGGGAVSAAVPGVDYLAPAALEPYRTAAAQDVIDQEQDARLDDLEQLTKGQTIGPAAVARFEAAAAGMQLKSVVADISPQQEGSGDPSPSNVRPFVGWTGAKIVNATSGQQSYAVSAVQEGSGDPSPSNVRRFLGALSFRRDDGTTLGVFSGTIDAKRGVLTITRRIFESPAYTIDTYQNRRAARIEWPLADYPTDRNTTLCTIAKYASPSVDYSWVRVSANAVRISFTSSTTDAEIRAAMQECAFAIQYATPVTVDLTAAELARALAALGVTASAFAVSWAAETGAVYGGTLDVTGGTLSAYPYYDSYNGEALAGPWLSSMDVYAAGAVPTAGAQVLDLGGASTEYNLESTPSIQTLQGVNNVWADCGNVTISYGAVIDTIGDKIDDLGDSILAAIAPLEADYTASRNYTAGSYLFVGTKFYKVTAAIMAGGAITPDTNVTQTTVAEQLIALAGA